MATPPAKQVLTTPPSALASGAPRTTMSSPPGQTGEGTYKPLWYAMGVVVFSIVTLPGTILLFFGLMPTAVAYVVDRTKDKYATFCVGSMNFVGVFPYLLEVWTDEHTPAQAFRILSNGFKLLVIFGMAGLGWTLYSLIPPVVSAIMVMLAQRRVEELRLIQEALVTDWGPEVSEPPAAAPPAAKPDKPRRRKKS